MTSHNKRFCVLSYCILEGCNVSLKTCFLTLPLLFLEKIPFLICDGERNLATLNASSKINIGHRPERSCLNNLNESPGNTGKLNNVTSYFHVLHVVVAYCELPATTH